MRFPVTVALVAATVAALAAPAGAAAKEWYVVMGSFPQGSSDADDRAYEVNNSCDLEANIGEGFDFVGMNPDVSFVYLGPFRTRSRANAMLPDARDCVPDAYVKSATQRSGE